MIAKLVKYIGHPVLVMSLYLILIIESENFGGFYMLYILMALPAGAPFAILSISGLFIVFLGYKIYQNTEFKVKPFSYLVGIVIMLLALIKFFSQRDRLATFELSIPTLLFILFGLSCLCCVINSVVSIVRKSPITVADR